MFIHPYIYIHIHIQICIHIYFDQISTLQKSFVYRKGRREKGNEGGRR